MSDEHGERAQGAASASKAPDGAATETATRSRTSGSTGATARSERAALDETARREALERSGAGRGGSPAGTGWAATAATTGAGAAKAGPNPRDSVPPTAAERHPERPAPRPDARAVTAARPAARPAARNTAGRGRRARLVLQRIDPWSVFLFSLVASICLGIVLLVAVATLFFVMSNLGVLDSINTLLGEVFGGNGPDGAAEPFFTSGRVLGAAAVLAAVDVVLLTVLATLGALLYNLCASLTGGLEVVLGERD